VTTKPIHRLSLTDLSAMDKDLIKEIAKQNQYQRLACYRITGPDATLILDTGGTGGHAWPAKFACHDYYYTLKNRQQLKFGWQATPLNVTTISASLKSVKSYLPPQDLWGTKLLFLVKKDGRATGETGELDGFMEALGRRFHFWLASDELRHFIDDTTSHEQIHAFGAMLSRMIGHEMRNPVTNLLSLAQTHALVWNDTNNEVSQFALEVERYAQNIWDVIQKLEVLAANGIDSFNTSEPIKLLDLKTMLTAECERENNRQDHASKAQLHLNIADGEHLIMGVGSLVRLAIREVLHNAFTYSSGTSVNVALYSGSGNIILDITDEGAPINPGQDELMFLRYFQGPKSQGQKSSIRRGLGLGLYLARFVSTFHNGQLLFVRGIGKKGAFRFIWPQAESGLKAS
jgi:signal transduction histidine kinase